MPNENTIVVIETTGHQLADITLIAHGDDERATHQIHKICLDAVRLAIETMTLPVGAPQSANEDMD